MPVFNEIKPHTIKTTKKIAAYITTGVFALGSLALYVKKMRLFKTVDKETEQ